MTALMVATNGGHLAQLAELAERMHEIEADRLWITFDSPQSRSLLAERSHLFIREINERDVTGVLGGMACARRLMRDLEVSAVVSTGSAIALSFLPLAALRGIPAHYIESSARVAGPSMTGRLLELVPRVRLYRQYPHAARGRWGYAGSVFDGFEAQAAAPREVRRVVVTVGSGVHGFRRLIDRLLAILPPGLEILWQTGSTAVNTLNAAGIANGTSVTPVDTSATTATQCFDPGNQPPVATDDPITTAEDAAVTVNVLANDSDVNGNLDPNRVTILVAPVNGVLTANGAGVFTYTPAPNFNGADRFSYQVCDTENRCATALVHITITPVNDAPICVNALPSIALLWPPNHQLAPIQINGVTDEEGDPLALVITGIRQDEPTSGAGNGDLAPDGQGIGTDTAQVRVERKGNGNGRYYQIRFTASDGHADGVCAGVVKVSVPKSMGAIGAAVDDGPQYDSTQP